MLVGSEGILGVITEAWMRVRPRPVFKATAVVEFDRLSRGGDRSGPCDRPVAARPEQLPADRSSRSRHHGAGDGSATLLLLGFESADVPVGDLLDQAIGDRHATTAAG